MEAEVDDLFLFLPRHQVCGPDLTGLVLLKLTC